MSGTAPRAVRRRREGISEYMETRHCRVMEPGAALPPSQEPGPGDFARTTAEWATGHGVPVQHGVLGRLAWHTGRRWALLVPTGAGLLPAGGAWLPADDVERDGA